MSLSERTLGAATTGEAERLGYGIVLAKDVMAPMRDGIRLATDIYRNLLTPGPAHQQEGPTIFGSRAPFPLLAHRPDVLVYQTPPLNEPLWIVRPIVVKLWVSSSAPDTDFTAKLLDIYPPNQDYPQGYHMNLCDSVIRCRYRQGWDREVFMEPGGVYPVTITLTPTSNLFAAGHRVAIHISSSNFPRLDLNPNTGEPIGRHSRLPTAVNTVHSQRMYPSHVVLPVMA